jgi:SAM-dependent methyltransferase
MRRAALPARYGAEWRGEFERRVAPLLRPGVRILDVGSGRRPAIPSAQRPPGCLYVGLDISLDELRSAPAGSYDQMRPGDVAELRPELEGRFDLAVSWQVLEHVKPLDAALENIRRYLVPGGVLVALLSGKFSLFAMLNQAVPHSVAVWAMRRLLGRDPRTVFPAHYDRCWHDALRRMTTKWSEVEIRSRFAGAGYFAFLPPLQRLYLVYENWAARRGHRNLATHYLIRARR